MEARAFAFGAWVFLGALLLQVAWILTVPPFRGVDEFDHAYRAASVARGEWVSTGLPAPHGRGELLAVPRGIVRDAGPVCSSYAYTGPDNCRGVTSLDGGLVTVASAAARYNPAFYWVVGTAGRPFHGAGALYAMRLAASLLCSLFLAAAAWVVARWARTAWPLVGLVSVLTPVTIYSTSLPAPNGIEMCAALGLWVSLLGLRRVDPPTRRRFLLLAAAFAVPLAVVRGLGPLWLACIGAVWLVHLGWRSFREVVASHPGTSVVAGGVMVAAAAAGSAWTLFSGSLELEAGDPFRHPVSGTLEQVPLWFLQSIAAFPTRNEAAPTLVYATGGLALLGLVVAGFTRATGRERWVLAGTLLLALAVPVVLQLRAYSTAGPIWQGRYGWPLSMGVLLLCALALDERPPRHRIVPALLGCLAALWVLAHVVSTIAVVTHELASSPLAGDGRWFLPDPALIAVLSAGGVLAWCVGAWRWAHQHPHLHTAPDDLTALAPATPEPVGAR